MSSSYRNSSGLLTGAPDPASAVDAASFLSLLGDLRTWAGQPSLRRLRMLAGKCRSVGGDVIDALPISTISSVLGSGRLPRGEFLVAYVRACLRARDLPAGIVDDEVQRWMTARHQLGSSPSPVPSRTHPSRLVPRQLPAPPACFTGRTRELARLDDLAAISDPDAIAIRVVSGPGGVGKTWLTLHWAHQNKQLFPDGQLYANLRGFDPAGDPLAPTAVLYAFLTALGVERAAVPDQLHSQAALYRSLLADRSMLIVLDNARDSAHVEALLPGSPSCMVLVTSRNQLCGLVTGYGAHALTLGVFQHSEARELLDRRLGSDRLAAEHEAVDAVLESCAGLPLALSIVAARTVNSPDLPLAVLAKELAEETSRLDALSVGDLAANVRAAFSSSYNALDVQTAEVFQFLGLLCGPDISLAAAESLTGLPVHVVRWQLQHLHSANLVQRSSPDRYRMHDLLRLYATDLATSGLSAEAQDEALERLVGFYVRTASACDSALEVIRAPHGFGPARAPETSIDRATALEWFEAELPCLLAALDVAVCRGWDIWVWQLAHALNHTQRWRGQLSSNFATWEAGLAAAERLNDPVLQAWAHVRLGPTCARLGRSAEAVQHLRKALDLFETSGDTFGQAHTYEVLAAVLGMQDDDKQALTHAAKASRLYQRLGFSHGEAGALNTVGWFQARLGDYHQARIHCERSLDLYRWHGNWHGEAAALDSLGFIARRTAQYDLALEYYGEALDIYREAGNRIDEADTQTNLGDSYAAAGRSCEARRAWSLALDLYQALGCRRQAELVGSKLEEI